MQDFSKYYFSYTPIDLYSTKYPIIVFSTLLNGNQLKCMRTPSSQLHKCQRKSLPLNDHGPLSVKVSRMPSHVIQHLTPRVKLRFLLYHIQVDVKQEATPHTSTQDKCTTKVRGGKVLRVVRTLVPDKKFKTRRRE